MDVEMDNLGQKKARTANFGEKAKLVANMWRYRKRGDREKKLSKGCMGFVGATIASAIIVIIFGIVYFHVFQQPGGIKKRASTDATCDLPILDHYTLNQDVKFARGTYHWSYRSSNGTKIQHQCPTSSSDHDADMFFDGSFVGGTVAKSNGQPKKTHIIDCHRTLEYVVRFGDMFSTTVDGVPRLVNYEIRDKDENDVLGYSTGAMVNVVTIPVFVPGQTEDVATLRFNSQAMTVGSDSHSWDIEVKNMSHPMADPHVLFALVAIRSFHSGGTDGCNHFVTASLVIFVLFFVMFFVFVYLTYLWSRKLGQEVIRATKEQYGGESEMIRLLDKK